MANFETIKIELDDIECEDKISKHLEAAGTRVYYRLRSQGSGEYNHGAISLTKEGCFSYVMRGKPYDNLSSWISACRLDMETDYMRGRTPMAQMKRNTRGNLPYYFQVKLLKEDDRSNQD